ncbi:glycosyl hydrolase 115 family protein [Caulobacter zeae]|nr:glycosyl hydrolase 115 family protein [Caulobacter zeae]
MRAARFLGFSSATPRGGLELIRMKYLLAAIGMCTTMALSWGAQAAPSAAITPVSVVSPSAKGALKLVAAGQPAFVVVDAADLPAVRRVAVDLQADLARVAGAEVPTQAAKGQPIVILGTIGHSPVIDRLIAERKLDVSGIAGQWEGFVQQVVDKPAPGVARALVIAGADRRGAIFGAYDLSERIGVSPWAWWADVPTPVRQDLAVSPGRRAQKPVVKYRGIFLNDEDPGLSSWAKIRFGGVNSQMYEKVFELILRLRGNYLWPAMWGKSIFEDDPLSAQQADAYGVVLGTSHHEPMMRAQKDWARQGGGAWDYTTNKAALEAFWRDGVRRMGARESVVTIGMRGDGDEPMTKGTATELLETIVGDQRRILGEVTGKDPAATPQVWALYKEVQDYYDAGMRVPDDVTLLFSDDNWGNIRRLPEPGKARAGGYGVYYHFDYVGGPRSYKWINTNQIERTWEQMKLAADYGADKLWIVNVGDLKPMELPVSFFLDMAWDPAGMSVEAMDRYATDWAKAQFGAAPGEAIGPLLEGYTRLNARRKPELLNPDTFSLIHEREAERVLAEWDDLEARTLKVGATLPTAYRDAFFQLVQYPIQASANLTRLYVAAGRNQLYAAQGRASAKAWGDQVGVLFARDSELTRQYHEDVAGGKWRGMMSQVHIGYTSWDQPRANTPPSIKSVPPGQPRGLGVAVEGNSKATWAGSGAGVQLPVLDVDSVGSRWIDVFHGGKPFAFTATADQSWLKISQRAGRVDQDVRLEISVDWRKAPTGLTLAQVEIQGGNGERVAVTVPVSKPAGRRQGYVEVAGLLTIEAEHYSRAVAKDGLDWRTIPNLGRTLSGVAAFPSTAPSSEPGGGPWLEYPVDLQKPGALDVIVLAAPSLDFRGKEGLRFGVSFDDGPVKIVTLNLKPDTNDWNRAVASNAAVGRAHFTLAKGGARTLKLWRIDPGLVFETVMTTRQGLPATFLGPRESIRR